MLVDRAELSPFSTGFQAELPRIFSLLSSISSPPPAGLRTCIGTGEILDFLLQRFSGSFWTLHGQDLRNKGTDPEDTVEMMLTSTLPLAGQRQRAPTQEHGRSEETQRHPGRQSLWNAGQRSGGQAVSLECLSCTELGGYPSWSPMVCAADCRRARGRLS